MFILIGFDNDTRMHIVKQFKTQKTAWAAMKKEMLGVNNAEFAKTYKNDADDSGFIKNAAEYGIANNTAWANCSNGTDYNWSIQEIKPEKTSDPKDGKVTVVCYGEEKVWNSRKEAAAFYLDCMSNSDGSECLRYVRVYTSLMAGEDICTDDEF